MADHAALIDIITAVHESLQPEMRGTPPPIVAALKALFVQWVTAPPTRADALRALQAVYTRHHRPLPAALHLTRSPHVSFSVDVRQDERSPSTRTITPPGMAALESTVAAFVTAQAKPDQALEAVCDTQQHAPLDALIEAPTEARPDTYFDVHAWTQPAEGAAAASLIAPVTGDHTTVAVALVLPRESPLVCSGATKGTLTAQRGAPSVRAAFRLSGPPGTHTYTVLFMVDGRSARQHGTVHIHADADPLVARHVAPVPSDATADYTLIVLRRDAAGSNLRFLLYEGPRRLAEADRVLSDADREALFAGVGALGELSREKATRQLRRLKTLGRNLTRAFLPDAIAAALAATRPRATLSIENEGLHLPWPLLWIDNKPLGVRLAVACRPHAGPPATLGGPIVAVDGGRVTFEHRMFRPLRSSQVVLKSSGDLEDRLADPPPIGLVHIAAHARMNRQTRRAFIEIDGFDFQPSYVARDAACEGALVVINACSAGALPHDLSGHGPWIETFLEAGAAAVVAPVFNIGDAAASAFAERLYDALGGGDPLAVAVRQTMRSLLKTHPTVAAYAVYAHHATRWLPSR